MFSLICNSRFSIPIAGVVGSLAVAGGNALASRVTHIGLSRLLSAVAPWQGGAFGACFAAAELVLKNSVPNALVRRCLGAGVAVALVCLLGKASFMVAALGYVFSALRSVQARMQTSATTSADQITSRNGVTTQTRATTQKDFKFSWDRVNAD
ncbi:MAG: hypothetical protein ACOYKZ_02125 [Chlamydiia bacterium]